MKTAEILKLYLKYMDGNAEKERDCSMFLDRMKKLYY